MVAALAAGRVEMPDGGSRKEVALAPCGANVEGMCCLCSVFAIGEWSKLLWNIDDNSLLCMLTFQLGGDGIRKPGLEAAKGPV
jgi:hypothetical protein